MDLATQARLFKTYPKAFRKPAGFPDPEIDQEPMAPIDYWGIECDRGWAPLIESVADLLERHLVDPVITDVPEADRPRFTQIKEKLGTLRLHILGRGELPSALRTAIEAAESASSSCCERCGAPGILHTTGYRRVVCEPCLVSPLRTINDWNAHDQALKALLASRSS